MGSSLSLQSKDKRRRSNRLSKPPQIQAIQGCPDPPSSRQPTDQALSLPTTPTTWQDPWTGGAVSISPREVVSQNPRSQSFSVKPLQRETGLRSNGFTATQRSIQSTAEIWPQSPTSPTPAPNRRGSAYGRASFHPSETATFQPMTLQSNPQAPLIGQPKRSYSVHSPSLKPKNSVQRRTIDRFASLSSHSRVNSQEVLPIRRRSLLMRPGVATRKATKDIPPPLISESHQTNFVSPSSDFDAIRPPCPDQGDLIVNGFETQSGLRPPTPSDFEYTHLGAHKLGTLRVVNGSASPCPSDRTRLDQAGNATPEAIPDNARSACLRSPMDTEVHKPRPMSPDELEVYKKYYPILENAGDLDYVMDNLSYETKSRHIASVRSDIPATMLSIPSLSAVKQDADFPASPFSYEKSPTSLSSHRMELYEIEDEGVSVHGKERALTSLSEKVPERHLSYSSCASSHRRADSGYSSAASHRNSIDSHASLRRSPGFQKLALAESSREPEPGDTNVPSGIISHNPINYRSHVHRRPMSMTRAHRERTQTQINGRLRGLSLPTCGTPSQAPSLPLYCAQLRNTDPSIPAITYTTTPEMLCRGTEQVDKTLYLSRDLRNSTCACLATFPELVGSGRGIPPSVTTHPCRRHTRGAKSKTWLPVSDNGFPCSELTSEPPRGRTRSRSIGYPHRTATSELY